MRIKWYGTATLLIESGDERILIDPYLKKYNPKLFQVPLDEARSAQGIFITHPHLDHFADIDAFTEGTSTPVFVSEGGITRAEENGLNTDHMIACGPNEEIRLGRFIVHTYQSKHCVFDAPTVLRVTFAPRTWLRAKDAVAFLNGARRYKLLGNDIYALHISDGEKSVTVLGSAGMDEDVMYPQESDLLVFPYQGRSRMHRYMIGFLKAFRPKAVMADHFDDAFPPLTHREDLKKFAPTVQKILPNAAAILPQEGEWYEI